MTHALQSIAHACRGLKSITLDVRGERNQRRQVDWTPLLQCDSLTSFSITYPHTLPFDPDHLSAMLARWRHIGHLSLNPSPRNYGTAPALPLSSLLAIAQSGPLVQNFEAFMTFNQLSELNHFFDAPSYGSVLVLNLGWTTGRNQDVLNVAAALYRHCKLLEVVVLWFELAFNSRIMSSYVTARMLSHAHDDRQAFEWVVRDLQKLKDYVENTDAAPAEGSAPSEAPIFDVLKESPTLGDGKFKLEIAKSAVVDASDSEPVTPVIRVQHPSSLSLYITSVVLEYAHADYEIYTSIFTAQTVARKRIIYAHSDILKRRSDYFATMLNSSFSENVVENRAQGERKVYTIIVEEADFSTIYWLLKWVYGNWTLFREQDDPKAAVDGVGAGWSAKSLKNAAGTDEWEWKIFSKHYDSSQDLSDARSVASLESGNSNTQKAKNLKGKQVSPSNPNASGANNALSTMRSTGGAGPSRQPPSPSKSLSNRPPASPTRRTSSGPPNAGNQLSLTVPMPPSPTPSPRSKTIPLAVSPTAGNFPTSGGPHHPLSPRQQRQRSRPSSTGNPDPHPHPVSAPPPASALSMYQVAHRYAMPGLASLALEHMMSTITPQSSFALLLATSTWDELHALVEDYVVDKWDEVSVSSDFEQCCQEVAGGDSLCIVHWQFYALLYFMLRVRLGAGLTQRRFSQWRTRSLATIAQDSSFQIPLIDFSKFISASSQAEKRRTADEIVSGFKKVGFIYLENHGIPEAVVQNVFRKSDDFFNLPSEVKDTLAWKDPRANRGYVRIGRERVTQSSDPEEIAKLRSKAPDYKESMEIGRDWDTIYKNHWPQESDAPGFKSTITEFFQTCHALHAVVMRAIALGLDLDEKWFDTKIHEQFHNMRLLSYPSIKTDLLGQEGQARAGAHSDYGTLTLLFQDSVGGLEVQHPHTLQFQPATPIPGTIVVNAGDLLARWSNDTLKSTLHRVVAPPVEKLSDTEGVIPARQSIAFFCNPNGGAEIDCIPSCFDVTRGKKYPSVTTEEYIVGRLKATYD
ncbi:hypothetical protein EUX98_g3496 [Antrodiella citrinella]|uniref:Fe2OG dioxygenase domain-containing protein n=1 Tax=Antrodiella citrinella TaxID=2447956 RepID=A0A4S4MWE9_9APHY|nr:hypothetical protein EUX98_g3496 [Antrodiella citrinella]